MIAPRHKLAAQVAATVVVGLLLAWGVFRLAVYEAPTAPRAAAAAPAPEQVQAVVVSVEGDVERGREGGAWSALAPGETVQNDELLRTGAHGKTALRIGPRANLTLEASSELRVRELTTLVHRFRLTRGRMTADYDLEGERVLRVEDGSGGAVAETQSARVSILSTGTTIAVATAAGQVSLRSGGEAVSVASGEVAYAAPGQRPSEPRRLPAAVLLKVANALTAASASLCAEVRGEAPPGSEVRIDGVPCPLEPDGTFRKRVPRPAGRQDVLVEIVDAAGRRRARRVRCVPPSAAIKDMAIRWNEEP